MVVRMPRPALILWRHVLRELVPPTLLGFVVFTFLMLMRYLLDISELWIQHGAELSSVLQAVVYSLPHIVVLTLPMAVLVGGLVAFGRMSADFEVVAMRALGISLVQLLPPVLILAVTASLANGWLFLYGMPWGNQALRELQWDTMTQRALSQEIKPRVFHDDFPDLVLYIEDVVDQGREWRGVFAAQGADPPAIVRAERAYPWIDDDDRSTYLQLERGTIVVSTDDPRDVTVFDFEQRDMLVWSEERDSILGGPGADERSMTLAELRQRIAEREAAGDPAADLRVEVHKKFAFSFACIIFALISLPLGVSTERQTTTRGYAIGTGVILVYYWFAQNGEQMAEAGEIPAWVGMWTANLVLGVAAVVLLWVKSREFDLGIVNGLRALWETVVDHAGGFFARMLARTAAGPGRGTRGQFPRLLDRYVLRTYGAIYGLSWTSLVLIFVTGAWLDKLSYVENPEFIAPYMRYYLFQIIFDVIPIAAVLTVLATFSLMSRTSEVTAALAGGVSLYRLVAPILVPALLLSGVHFVLQDAVLPHTSAIAREYEQQMDPDNGTTMSETQSWIFSEGRRVFHFAEYLGGPPRFRGLQVYYLSDGPGGIARMEFADLVEWNPELNRWEGHDGWRRFFLEPEGETGTLVPTDLEEFRFAVMPIPESPEYFGESPVQPEEMSVADLSRHVELLRERGYETHQALVDLHLKLSFPAITLVMTLVGIPFAFRMGRQGALTGIGIGIGLVIAYWITFGVFRALGYAGTLPPLLSAWAPHLLFFALAGYQALGLRT